jgi:uncharacterized protein YndB with AHSA1/START domain
VSDYKLVAEPGSHHLVITQTFDASRERIFAALTDPELVAQWWGPEGVTTTIDEMDARKGGIWRNVQRDAEGNEYAFSGVYHDVTAPERLIYTFEFEGMPGHVLMETITLTEQADGRTLMTDASVFQSVEDRDGMLSYGMEDGARSSMERLTALLSREVAGV